jgi:hypothetical protein
VACRLQGGAEEGVASREPQSRRIASLTCCSCVTAMSILRAKVASYGNIIKDKQTFILRLPYFTDPHRITYCTKTKPWISDILVMPYQTSGSKV